MNTATTATNSQPPPPPPRPPRTERRSNRNPQQQQQHGKKGVGVGTTTGTTTTTQPPKTKAKATTIQGPLLILVGLCLLLVGNFVYDAWSHYPNNTLLLASKPTTTSTTTTTTTSTTKQQQQQQQQQTNCWTKEPVYGGHDNDSVNDHDGPGLGLGFCSTFPADKTASYLWNQNTKLILEMTKTRMLDDDDDARTTNNNNNVDNNDDDDEHEHEWMHDLLHTVLRPVRLRDGLRSLPQAASWGRFVERLHDKLQQQPNTESNSNTESHTDNSVPVPPVPVPVPPPPVSIVVLGGSTVQGVGSCVLPSSMTKASKQQQQQQQQQSSSSDKKKASSSFDHDSCAWPVRLQTMLDRLVGPGVVQVTVVAIPTATTELFTAMLMKDGGGGDSSSDDSDSGSDDSDKRHAVQTADLILHAAGSQDNYQFDRRHATMENVQYQEHQRRVQQDFIRASLQSQPCRDNDADDDDADADDAEHNGNKRVHMHAQPAVVYLDDYLSAGQGHETMVADTVTARVIHQLVDYYTAVGLVSYASVVNRLVTTMLAAADTEHGVFGGGGGGGGDAGGSLNYGKVAHVGVLWTLVFAALEFTVDYCSHVTSANTSQDSTAGVKNKNKNNNKNKPFISEDVFRRVNTVPPPYLNGNTSLVTVSEEWIQEEKKWRNWRKAVCGKGHNGTVQLPPSCVLAVTSNVGTVGGPNKKATSLQDYFKPATLNKSVGWKLLVETGGTLRATQAKASLTLEMVVPEHQSISSVQVFVVREDVDAKTKSTSALTSTAALLQIKVILPGNDEKSVEVEATHNSAARVALPVRIEVQPPAAAGTLVKLELRLIEGETVDIEGVFVC
jgi:hypothetical protein